jgi:hypothetical protein
MRAIGEGEHARVGHWQARQKVPQPRSHVAGTTLVQISPQGQASCVPIPCCEWPG